MSLVLSITASYAFLPLEEAECAALREELLAFGTTHAMKGLVLIAPEGINSTVCGTPEAIAAWKTRMRALKSNIVFKDSRAEGVVFRRWSVKIKPELITYKQPVAPAGPHKHLSPAAWKQKMETEDVIVVDTRNTYETAIGTFANAVTLPIRHFHRFPEAIRDAAIPKDKTVMLYCTGGIRCEKAVLTMEAMGYTNVHQLEGGILAYMKQFPNDAFKGECFVFDHRVAVDQQLKPSTTYTLCADCGDPAPAGVCAKCTTVSVA